MSKYAMFSGGRSSAAMLLYLADSGADVDCVIFNNTGMETPETLEFAHFMQSRILKGWDVPFVWLELSFTGKGKRTYRIVNYKTACRDGRVFRQFVQSNKAIPYRKKRTCTTVLKVQTTAQFIQDREKRKDIAEAIGLLGIRADEPRRVSRIGRRNDLLEQMLQGTLVNAAGKKVYRRYYDRFMEMPLVDAGMDKTRVMARLAKENWRGLSFDPADLRVRLSNCQGCFFSSLAEQIEVARSGSYHAKEWMEMEDLRSAWGGVERYKVNRRAVAFYRRHFAATLPPHEAKKFTFNENMSWETIHRLSRRRSLVMPEALCENDEGGGGCMDGYCNTD